MTQRQSENKIDQYVEHVHVCGKGGKSLAWTPLHYNNTDTSCQACPSSFHSCVHFFYTDHFYMRLILTSFLCVLAAKQRAPHCACVLLQYFYVCIRLADKLEQKNRYRILIKIQVEVQVHHTMICLLVMLFCYFVCEHLYVTINQKHFGLFFG